MKILNSTLIALIIGAMLWLFVGEVEPIPVSYLPHPTSVDTVTVDSVQWNRPRFSEREKERHQMVTRSIKKEGVSDSQVLKAMRRVPRHLFVPKRHQQYAYQNRPLPIGHDQTISQPFIVGYMTEMLDLTAGEKVLEIGTDSGYQFDAIILTAAPDEIPEPLIKQLARGGVLVAPVGESDQTQILTKVTKSQDGSVHRVLKLPVRFVPMTGKSQSH